MKYLLTIIVFIIFNSIIIGAGSGKISGTITDHDSGEPLIGANIILLNTNYGAATDVNGYFTIIGIPPGKFSVKVSSIGYQSKVITDVQIVSELTTDISLSLSSQTIDLEEEVIIVAERPVVQKDLTSTRVVVSGEVIVDELRAQNIATILDLQPGVTYGTDGRFHIRGGRAGGSVIQVDGIPLINPFSRTGSGEVEVESIQEFQALLGTFNAEFGNASDGIINISTKDGGSEYSAKILFESSQLNSSPYHEKDWSLDRSDVKSLSVDEKEEYRDAVRKPDGTSAYDFMSVLDDEYVNDQILIKMLGTFVANLSGPIPYIPGLTFFASGRLKTEDSQLPWGYDIYKSFTGKLTYLFTPQSQLRFTYSLAKNTGQNYNHRYKYWRWFDSGLDSLDRRGSYPVNTEKSNRQILNFKQVLSNKSFFDITFGRVYDFEDDVVPNRNVTYDSETGELIDSDYYRRLYVSGNEANFRYGDVRYWLITENTQYIIKGNYENQISNNHLIRTGFDFKQHDIFRHRMGMPPRENLQYFNYEPVEFAAYLQDKVEYSFMILNLGIRMDYFDPNATAYPDQGDILEVYTDETGVANYRATQKEDVKPHIQISPRIGLAHPISDMTSIYFAYGHFFQIPRFYDLYRNNDLNDILVNDALVGNEALKPEKTVSFEVGLQQQISEDWGLSLTAYTKDISNLISSQYYFVGRDYSSFTNADFGTVRGVDLTIDKQFNNFYSFRLTYSLMSAMGNASDPLEGYNSYREDDAHLRPNRNFPLDFDQRHKLVSLLTLRLPKGFGGSFFELFSFNTVFTVNSGLPYTPTSRDIDESGIVPEPNSARRPWTYNLDFRMSKEIPIDMFNLTMYLNIENVLDRENTRFIWSRTGDALSEGPTSIRSFDRQANPANLFPRRSVIFGVYLDF